MIYLVGQIVFWLLVAVIFGFLLGWYFKGISVRKIERESEEIPSQRPIEEKVELTSPVETEPTVTRKDDLKKIKGIGPFLEKQLNELGIQTFEQISRWNEQDILKFSEHLEHFPKRIIMDDWVGQSKKLREV